MATKVAINGFGRIGRNVARAILERTDHDLELVSINDLADAKANARLFKYDSVHGAFPGSGETDGNDLIINGKRIHVTAERDPAKLPHEANGVEIALECTGFFTNRQGGQAHLDAGARRVLISAPAKEVDLTVVFGVNHDKLTAEHKIVFELFDGLTSFDKNGLPVPSLAERGEVAPDLKSVRFELRASARWSNGRPLVAADFVYGPNAPV